MGRKRGPARTRGEDPRPTPRREKQTLIPAFDPADLARELEQASSTPTITPPFDPSSYARIVDEHVSVAGAVRDTPRTLTAARPRAVVCDEDDGDGEDAIAESTEAVGRAMYGCYLSSDFPEALVLAERVLEQQPEHALAQLVAERCRAVLSEATPINPSSVLRLKSSMEELRALGLDAVSAFVLDHVDGVVDAATVADLAGIPRNEAMGRLHALLDLGVLEIVNG
jgi:hypothetical protein